MICMYKSDRSLIEKVKKAYGREPTGSIYSHLL